MSRYDDDNGFGGSLNRPGREALDREEASWQAYNSKCEAITQSKLQAEIYTLKAENAALHAECDRLTALLQWEQNRRDQIGTHGDECWKWGPAHYECALRETERLTAMLGPEKVLSAEEVTKPGFYWWRGCNESGWNLVDVFNDREDFIMFTIGDDCDKELVGQFVGPLKTPEVRG